MRVEEEFPELVWLDWVELNCPVCEFHLVPNKFIQANLRIGEKLLHIDVNGFDQRKVASENFFKEKLAPFGIVLKKEIFMGRERYRPLFLTIGSFDEVGNYWFKREVFKIKW